MFALFSPLVLVATIILILAGLLFWHLRRPGNQAPQISWIEKRHDLQLWLLVLAAFAAGIFIAYLLFTAPIRGG